MTNVTMGGVTFTLSGTLTSGNDAAGKAWVVVPSGTDTITAITPNQTTDVSGDIINGAMLNPVRTATEKPNQGYDERQTTWLLAENDVPPFSVTAGDVIIKTIAADPATARMGNFTEVAALHVLASAPTGEYLLGSSISWVGKTTPDYYTIDLDAWYSNRTVYDSTGIDFPTYSELIASIGLFYPLFAQTDSSSDTDGYETLSPFRFGGGSTTGANYGRYVGQMIGTVMMAACSNAYTESETKNIARAILQHGIEWGDPILYGPRGIGADGGHYQFHQGPILFALSETGRTSEFADVMSVAPGNFEQAFTITQALFDSDFVEHSDTTKPATWRSRTLSTQPGGSVVRIPTSGSANSGDWFQTYIHDGMIATRSSDGQTAEVATSINFESTGTIDVALTAASPFSSGDVIYFDSPNDWTPVGGFDWNVLGFTEFHMYSPSALNTYRNTQAWMGQMLGIAALGLYDTSLDSANGYLLRAEESNVPKSDNDYPTIAETWKPTGGSAHTTASDFYSKYSGVLNISASVVRSPSASFALL